jgi:hypothetical protein
VRSGIRAVIGPLDCSQRLLQPFREISSKDQPGYVTKAAFRNCAKPQETPNLILESIHEHLNEFPPCGRAALRPANSVVQFYSNQSANTKTQPRDLRDHFFRTVGER